MRYRIKIQDAFAFRENVLCMIACPVHTDSGRYVHLIAEGKLEDAYLVARSPNPFASVCGRICSAPCEDACSRGKFDEPVSIRALKRVVTEQFGPESRKPETFTRLRTGEKDSGSQWRWHMPAIARRGLSQKKVAVIGAGPAGLACAHDLAVMGYKVTVFEASDRAGGMLYHGIPEYRLPRDVLAKEIEAVLSLGVELVLNTPLTPSFGIKELREAGHEAIFISVGAGMGKGLDIPGAELDGVIKALEFLMYVNRGYRTNLGRRVVVIGGGLVALDAARTALRKAIAHGDEAQEAIERTVEAGAMVTALDAARAAMRRGAVEVRVASLESFEEMPAAKTVQGREEIEEAKREGIIFHPSRGPKRILDVAGRVSGIELLKVKRVFDEMGRFNPELYPDTEEVLDVDSVILAVGQSPDFSFLKPEDGIELTRAGTIRVNPDDLSTSAPGVFAGGDAAFGPRIVIEAVANGKLAAQSIHHYFNKDTVPLQQRAYIEVLPARFYRRTAGYEQIQREAPPKLSPEFRTGMREVESCYSLAEAKAQAERCLVCHTNPIYNPDLCVLCGMCADVCPVNCLHFVPLAAVDWGDSNKDNVLQRLSLSENEPATALLKEDEKCIRCGLCAIRCPTEAITMERFSFEEIL